MRRPRPRREHACPDDLPRDWQQGAHLYLAPCEIPGLKRQAKCGTANVVENRALGHGRMVSLKVVVVPATQVPAAPDPVVYITGGPGGAATDEVVSVVEEYAAAAGTRDFVFIDQRRTKDAVPSASSGMAK